MRGRAASLFGLAAVACAAACGSRSGLLEGGGAGGSGGVTGSTIPTGGVGATGGSTGSSMTDPPACEPGEVDECYSGPADTFGVGQCTAGQRVCLPSGAGFGPCEGEVTPEPDPCYTEADEDCDGEGGVTCEASPYWSRSLPGGDGHVVTSDPAGNVILASFCHEEDLAGTPAGTGKFCIAKLDPYGTLLWSKVLGGGVDAMRLDAAGNMWVAGYFTGTIDLGGASLVNPKQAHDVFVAKLDPEANHLFSVRFGDEGGGDGYQYAWDLAVMPDGGAVIVGDFEGTIDFGGGVLTATQRDAFAVRLDESGNLLWSRALSGADDQTASSLVSLPDGSVVIAGSHVQEVDCGGGLLGSDGGYDIFVAKLDAAGDHVSCHRIGGADHDVAGALAAAPGGGFWLAGSFFGPMDFGATSLLPDPGYPQDEFLGRLAPDGSPIDAVSFPNAGYHTLRGMTLSPAGDVVLTGWFDSGLTIGDTQLAAPTAMFAARLSADGAPLWARQFGEGDYIGAYDVALDPDENVLVTGGFYGATLDFGDDGSPHAADDLGMFVVKMPP